MGGPDERETDRAVWDLEYRAELKSMLRQSFGGNSLKGRVLGGIARRRHKREDANVIPFQAKKDPRA